MLAYAASRPRFGARQSSPHAMLVIIAAHVGLLALVMSARPEIAERLFRKPIQVDLIPQQEPPPPAVERPRQQPRQTPLPERRLSVPGQRQVQLPPMEMPSPGAARQLPDIGDLLGPPSQPQPPQPRADPAPSPSAARLLTPPSELKPPYPDSKILSGEEALLTLRLTIDEQGRVVAVEPVGRTDRVFLEAARRHIVSHWRYKPATEGGRAVSSVVTITLRFQLD